MTWTSEKPTVPDRWYWWRVEPGLECVIFIAQDADGELYMKESGPDGGVNVTVLGGHWAGPIPEPEEAGG